MITESTRFAYNIAIKILFKTQNTITTIKNPLNP